MSQRPPAPGFSFTHEAGNYSSRNSTGQSSFAASPTEPSSPSAWRHGGLSQHQGRAIELPPLLRVSNPPSGGTSPSIPRSVTLPSVLNPVSEEPTQRRRKLEELNSPYESAPTLPPLIGSAHGAPSVASPSGTPPPLHETLDRSGRRILTPKSPLRRAISLSQLNPPSGNINAQQNPFPTSPRSRSYMVEPPTSAASTGPASSVMMRQPYGYPSMAEPADMSRRPSPHMGSVSRYSASPDSTHSPRVLYDQASPSSMEQTGHGYLPGADATGRGMSVPPGSAASHLQDPYGLSVSSGPGQSTYQMMTLKTSEGDVRFPVDVQAASRVADEKRRRNAGASARFRERRKKKEMEASATISKLEQQVKDLTEDVDFYRGERDVLASLVMQLPGQDRHFPRPTSPRLRRVVSGPSARSTSSNYYSQNEDDEPSPDTARNVRRRTSSFPMSSTSGMVQHGAGNVMSQHDRATYAPPPPPTSQSILTQHHPSNNQISTSARPMPSQATAQAPTSNMSSSGLMHTGPPSHSLPPPPAVMQAPPMTGPYNPFAAPQAHRFDPNNSARPSPHGR